MICLPDDGSIEIDGGLNSVGIVFQLPGIEVLNKIGRQRISLNIYIRRLIVLSDSVKGGRNPVMKHPAGGWVQGDVG